ncbi:MAG: hypothetical protein WAK31_29340 [Chthoniobacterales bacterium]
MKTKKVFARTGVISSVICLAALSAVSYQQLGATPTSVNPDYSVSVFATGTAVGFTNPDSIASHLGYVFVSYTNNAAPDGSVGNSNIVQYSSTGQVIRLLAPVPGSNDGLKYNPFDDTLWALRNQDANPAVTVFDITNGSSTDLVYANAPLHGGGYDDVVFVNDQVFLSASNPKLNAQGQNIYPSIVSATVVGNKIYVAPVVLGNATLTDIATGQPTVSPQSDPDSLTIDPSGDLVLDSQADGDLIFLRGPGFPNQAGFRLHLSDGTTNQVQVDDTVFPSATTGTIYVADTTANVIYAVTSNAIPPNSAFSASNSDGTLVRTDLISGQVTPIVTGFISPHGAFFAPALPQIRLQRASAPLTFGSKEVSASFLVSRTGDITQALTVYIRVTDHAKRDRSATSHLVQVVIPAGKSLVTTSIKLDSIADLNEDAGHQSCVVTVDPDPNYDVVPYVNDGGVQVVVIPTQTN